MLSKEECRILARFRKPIPNGETKTWTTGETITAGLLHERELIMFDHRIEAFTITGAGHNELVRSLTAHVEDKTVNSLRHQLDDDRRCTIWGTW